MWVCRTRASLELVLEAAPSNGSDCTGSTASSETLIDDGESSENIKEEPNSPKSLTSTRWVRRKKGFKLKLEGISMRGKQRKRPVHADNAVRMLELFETMMEARMESCERVTRMVREANRDLR